MTKGEPKKKKSKNGVFTIYVRYDGMFTGGPLRYSQGDLKEISDVDFEGMSYENLVEILKRLFPSSHNKAGCKNAPQPKPETVKKQPGRKRDTGTGQCASRAGRGGIGSRGGRGGRGVGTRSGRGVGTSGSASGVGTTGNASDGIGSMAASGNEDVDLTENQKYQQQLDEEAFRECMEQQFQKEKEMAEKKRQEEFFEKKQLFDEHGIDMDMEEGPYNRVIPQQLVLANIHPTQESVIHDAQDLPTSPVASVDTTTSTPKDTPKKTRNMNKWLQKSFVNGQRIYHKNRGRSERIQKKQMSKAYQFDQEGTGSTPDKAFGVSDSE